MENRRAMRVDRQQGSALLLVLWLAAALSAIAFSLAHTVRGETGRTSTALDGLRAYYLATGAIDRALLYMQWGPGYPLPDGSSRYYSPWMTTLPLRFPTGDVTVEIHPEAAKLNINSASPEDLYRLLLALGADPQRATEIVQSILDWRTFRPEDEPSPFDRYYLSLTPSFRARHASFEEIEELLLVKGMTTELFHGAYVRDNEGRLVRRGGLKECVSVWGSSSVVDVNTAPAAVLAAVGVGPQTIAAVLEARSVRPFRSAAQLSDMGLGPGQAGGRLRIGGSSVFTLRATARLRLAEGKLSDMRRSVAATVKTLGIGGESAYTVLRWQDNAWAQ
jgi:general secretion pathway protein K